MPSPSPVLRAINANGAPTNCCHSSDWLAYRLARHGVCRAANNSGSPWRGDHRRALGRVDRSHSSGPTREQSWLPSPVRSTALADNTRPWRSTISPSTLITLSRAVAVRATMFLVRTLGRAHAPNPLPLRFYFASSPCPAQVKPHRLFASRLVMSADEPARRRSSGNRCATISISARQASGRKAPLL